MAEIGATASRFHPKTLRADLDAMVESERAPMRGHPKREAKACAEKLAEADRKRSRY